MFRSRLYSIVDVRSAAARGWDPADLARALVDGGADLLQVRGKALAGRDLLALCERILEDARVHGARLILNDRADVALVAGADGVHVGQDDLDPDAVRRVTGPGPLIGWSTHTRKQIDLALEWPIDYLAVGPVFGTSTKDTGYAAVGLDLVRYARARCGDLPVVAIGGITLDTAGTVVAAGATAVAVISDLLTGGDPAARVRAFLQRLPM